VSDVFVSFAHADADKAEIVVRFLENRGLTVWWDRRNEGGTRFRQEIERELEVARCVVVLWSRASRESDFVLDEATRGKERGVLVPVLVEDVAPALGFGPITHVRLLPWREAVDGPPMESMHSAVRKVLARSSGSPEDVLGACRIDRVQLGQAFLDSPLPEARLTATYRREWIEWPSQHRVLFESLLAERQARAEEDGETLDNNGGYSLRWVRPQRDQDGDNPRVNGFDLLLYPSDYFHFVVPNTLLDRRVLVPPADEPRPLREIIGLEEDRLSLDTLRDLPYHFRIGTGTLIETADGYWILTVRSRTQLVAKGGGKANRVHVSAAEGMLRGRATLEPTVDVNASGMPTPFQTAVRALEDELALRCGDKGTDYSRSSLKLLGYFLDKERAQPFFIFLLRDSNLTRDAVFRRWNAIPPDRHENRALFAVRAEAAMVGALCRGDSLNALGPSCPDRDSESVVLGPQKLPSEISSNQARTGLVFGAAASLGLNEVVASVRACLAEDDRSATARGTAE